MSEVTEIGKQQRNSSLFKTNCFVDSFKEDRNLD